MLFPVLLAGLPLKSPLLLTDVVNALLLLADGLGEIVTGDCGAREDLLCCHSTWKVKQSTAEAACAAELLQRYAQGLQELSASNWLPRIPRKLALQHVHRRAALAAKATNYSDRRIQQLATGTAVQVQDGLQDWAGRRVEAWACLARACRLPQRSDTAPATQSCSYSCSCSYCYGCCYCCCCCCCSQDRLAAWQGSGLALQYR